MSTILKFDFQKRKQLRFPEVNYLNYTKTDPILPVATTFSLKQGETRTSHGPIPHPLNHYPVQIYHYGKCLWLHTQQGFHSVLLVNTYVHSTTLYIYINLSNLDTKIILKCCFSSFNTLHLIAYKVG